MDYYNKNQLVGLVDENDKLIGKIDKWEAHKKGLLHRGYTVCLFYQEQIILQHRKHPVFDGYYDLTFSSHPIFEKDAIQADVEAVYESLLREWNIKKEDLKYEPKQKGSVYYKAKDPQSEYVEHEICHLFVSEVSSLPSPHFDYAYGYSLVSKAQITDSHFPITKSLAPWVFKLITLL